MAAPCYLARYTNNFDIRKPLFKLSAVLVSSSQFPLDLYLRFVGKTLILLSHLYISYESSSDIIIINQNNSKTLQPLINQFKRMVKALRKDRRYDYLKRQRQQFYYSLMLQLKQLYSTVIREPQYGVQGYHVDKKYFDSRRSREQKVLAISKERSSTMKPSLASKKSNFLDQILKKQAKLPGPSTYSPKQYERSTKKIKVQSPPRLTYIQQMQRIQQKYNFPAPGKYDKLQIEVDKTKKQRSSLSKAEVCNYLDNSMRNSIEMPGVGSYNAKIQLFDKKGVSIWKKPNEVKGKKSMSQRGIKAAEVGTYNPIPVAYDIFESISHLKQKKSKSYFSKQQRFKNSKDKTVPFYNVGSQWGMKDKIHKKDILSRVGSSLTHHSIYY